MTTTEFAAELTLESPSLICCAIRSTSVVGRPINARRLARVCAGLLRACARVSTYLAELALRLDEGHTRRAVLANMGEEMDTKKASHPAFTAEMWMDFAEGIGAGKVFARPVLNEIKGIGPALNEVASEGSVEEALAAFYAYDRSAADCCRKRNAAESVVWSGRQVVAATSLCIKRPMFITRRHGRSCWKTK